jgi:shikimate kinase
MSLANKNDVIYLVGMMGAGKTTVAPVLAQYLGYCFVDTDLEVERMKGKSCHEIVDDVGVDGFRALETQVLAEISFKTRLVVACGGGIILRQENWNYLRKNNAIVIWLNLPLEEIHKRIKDELRANLRGLDSLQLKIKLKEIFAQRHLLYAKADLHISLDGKETPQKVAFLINEALEDFGR